MRANINQHDLEVTKFDRVKLQMRASIDFQQILKVAKLERAHYANISKMQNEGLASDARIHTLVLGTSKRNCELELDNIKLRKLNKDHNNWLAGLGALLSRSSRPVMLATLMNESARLSRRWRRSTRNRLR